MKEERKVERTKEEENEGKITEKKEIFLSQKNH